MPTTPNLELPYPTSADTADVPRDLEALAAAVDSAVADGVLLAAGQYVPGGDVTVVLAPNAWVCPAAQDTNMAIGPVVAPASGRVLVKMRGGYIAIAATGTLLGGITTSLAGQPAVSNLMAIQLAGSAIPYFCELLIAGLTPGGSYSFYPWAYVQGTNGNFTVSNSGLQGGGFLMQVHSA